MSLTAIASTLATQPSWAGSDLDAATASVPAPELLGIPLLTLLWLLTGVLAIVAGLTVASRRARQPAVRDSAEQRTDHGIPGINQQGKTS